MHLNRIQGKPSPHKVATRTQVPFKGIFGCCDGFIEMVLVSCQMIHDHAFDTPSRGVLAELKDSGQFKCSMSIVALLLPNLMGL